MCESAIGYVYAYVRWERVFAIIMNGIDMNE